MPTSKVSGSPCIGIIANPVSARDIRRIVANAGNLQITDRVSMLLRLLSAAGSAGVKRALMMPDKGGVSAMLIQSLKRESQLQHAFPEIDFLDMAPTTTVSDTYTAARMMQAAGVRVIVVLGGDGTHRAVVRECRSIPLAGMSTGTNNAFPEMREPTITGLAVGLYASGQLGAEQALVPNKLLEISINDGARRDIALVDAVISSDRFIGARALWKMDSLSAVYLSFAEPQAIGMSSIGGLLQPIGRSGPGGLAIQLSDDQSPRRLQLLAPVAPGMVRPVGISHWEPMPANQPFTVVRQAGVVALDGERELTFDSGDRVQITLRENAFPTVDVAACMQLAAAQGLFRHFSRQI